MANHRGARLRRRILAGVMVGGLALSEASAQVGEELGVPPTPPEKDPFVAFPGSQVDRSNREDPFIALPADRNEQDPLVARERMRRATPADTRPRGTTVRDRQRPDYDPIGVKIGAFTLLPSLTLGAGATSNAVPGADGGDLFGTARAAAVLRSDWSRHQLVFDGFVDTRQYLTYESESGTSWLARARGRLDVHGRSFISAEASTEQVFEERGTVGELIGSRRPVRYKSNGAAVQGSLSSGRITAQVQAQYRENDYEDFLVVDGVPIDQRVRDSETYEAGVDLGYQFGGPRSAFVSATKTWRRHDFDSVPRRDVNVLELLAGLRSEITPLIRGQIAVGYLEADFLDPAVSKKKGVAVDTSLEYLVTELTTINFRARRRIRNIQSPTSPAAVVTSLRLGADHELLRNLIISAGVRHESGDYAESPRKDRIIGGDIGANWLISPRWRANARLSAYKQKVEEPPEDRSFSAVTFIAGVTFQL